MQITSGKDTTNPPIVNVTIDYIPGNGITQIGMFNINVSTINSGDIIYNLQYIVSAANQTPGDFLSFCFLGNIPAPGLPSSIFYASASGVWLNQFGQALTVTVVGAINNIGNIFSISQSFPEVLWPDAACQPFIPKDMPISKINLV